MPISRALALTRGIETDEYPDRGFLADGFEQRFEAAAQMPQLTQTGNDNGKVFGHTGRHRWVREAMTL